MPLDPAKHRQAAMRRAKDESPNSTLVQKTAQHEFYQVPRSSLSDSIDQD
jgi:hypothetical protein